MKSLIPPIAGAAIFLRPHLSLAGFLTAAPAHHVSASALTGGSEGSQPINITGRETIYDSKAATFTVRGNTLMTQSGSQLHRDQIMLFRKQREAIATGHVHLVDSQVEIGASEAKVDVANETLDLYHASVNSKLTATISEAIISRNSRARATAS